MTELASRFCWDATCFQRSELDAANAQIYVEPNHIVMDAHLSVTYTLMTFLLATV